MATWQVGLRVRVEPGITGQVVDLVVDVEAPANDRYKAVAEALAALVHRTDVHFAICGPDEYRNAMIRPSADGQG